ncbi:hypothetical protein ACQ86N_30200 [Puia sp. P3]|uniref:hypothetical protein n=1 Tax=Puia sp. P3 TaxID=3423952 RepID=UPI003D664DD0
MAGSTAKFEPGIGRWFHSDEQYHRLYPESIRALAEKHWTPLSITKIVLEFLVPHAGVKVLDIGSGVGKFVLAGAYYKPDAVFFGVEQRKDLVSHASVARKKLGLTNAHFFTGISPSCILSLSTIFISTTPFTKTYWIRAGSITASGALLLSTIPTTASCIKSCMKCRWEQG